MNIHSANFSPKRFLLRIKDYINPSSLEVIKTVYAEPALMHAKMADRYQFLRKGYFTLDTKDTYQRLVFNRTVTLKDAWAKEQKK